MSESPSATFDSPDADVILRAPLQPGSSDFKDFRVHKIILSIASPVFRDTFSIPQPPRHTSDGTGLDVVQITESAEVVENFLQLIYPIDPPIFTNLWLLDDLLQLSDKYAAGGVTKKLKIHLASPFFLKGDPVGVFAVAIRNNLEGVARTAIPHTFSIDAVRQVSEDHTQRMTAKTYQLLLMEHVARRELLGRVLDEVQRKSYGGCGCFNRVKTNMLLEVSRRPLLDRDTINKCLTADCPRLLCTCVYCIHNPGGDSKLFSEVLRMIKEMK